MPETKQKKERRIVLQKSHVAAYRFIEKYVEKNTVYPLLTEVAKNIHMTLRQLYRILDDLESLGYISRVPFTKRGLKIEKEL